MTIQLEELPPSTNQVYRRSKQGTMYMTEEGHAFKNMLGYMAKLKWDGEPSRRPFKIEMLLEFPDNRARDINNFDKLVFDAFQDIVYLNDTQVEEWHVKKLKDQPKPRVTITLTEL